MGQTDQGEFVQVRHRRSSGQKKNQSSTYAMKIRSSTQRYEKKCQTTYLASTQSGDQNGSCKSRRSSGASECSSIDAWEHDDPGDPDISAPNIDFGEDGLNSGLLLELLIIEALAQNPELNLFKHHAEADHLLHSHIEGDLFTWLNVTRQWVSHLQKGSVGNWYITNNVNESTLRFVEEYVEARRAFLCQIYNQNIHLAFGRDSDIANELILNITLQKYNNNLCIYQGHPTLGYKNLSTGKIVFIHPTSSVNFLTKFPKYIIYIDTPLPRSNFVKAVVVLHDGLAKSLLEFNSKNTNIEDFVKENVVQPCIFNNISESISLELEKLWLNVKKSKTSLKDMIKYQCNGSPILIDFDRKLNKIIVNALPGYHSTIKLTIEDEIRKLNSVLKDEVCEIGFPNEKSHLRLLMGPGAFTEKLLFPSDFRSIWIYETKQGSLSEEFVMKEMQKFGKVDKIVLCADEDMDIWGTVTFMDPENVIKLLASTKEHDANMLIELAQNTGNVLQVEEAKVSIERKIKVQVKLCRRPAKSGLAFITVRGRREFGIFLATKTLTIGKVKVIISSCPGTRDVIQLSGISPLTEDEEVRDAIVNKLGIIPELVEVDRVPQFPCTAAELYKLRTSLQRIIDKATDISKVNIRVIMSSPNDLYLRAELRFETRRIAISAMDYIDGAKIKGLPLQVEINQLNDVTVPTVSIKVHDSIYNTVKSEVKKMLTRAPRNMDFNISFTEKQHIINIFSNSLVDADGLASRLSDLFTPTRLKISRRALDYLSRDGESFLTAAMDETKTHIDICKVKRTLEIYGPMLKIQEAKQHITEIVDRIMAANDESYHDYNYRIALDGATIPSTMMIEVAKDLERLALNTGVKNIKVDVTTHTLCYSACDEAHFAMQAMIESMTDIVKSTTMVDTSTKLPSVYSPVEEKPDCSACYCPVEGTCYTLQCCNHHYCDECITTHVKVSLENKRFPINCIQESCNQSICIKDIINISLKIEQGFWKVLKATCDHFVQTKPNQYGFCHKADCSGIVLKSASATSYCCPLCNGKMCPKCMNNYHGSQSCDDYMNNVSFQQWLGASTDRKKCPNCGMAIEKIDGCNRVHCTSCQRHICWKCLEHFQEMRLAYDHLNKEHGGYM